MASRFHKPDPQIRENVRRARAGIHHMGRIRALVAGASIAATIAAWATFAVQDASATTAQANGSGQYAVAVSAQQINDDSSVPSLQARVQVPVPFSRTRSSR